MDGPTGDVDEPLARHDALEYVDPERGRRVADVPGRVRRVERYPVFEVDVAGAGEEGDAVADAEGEVAVTAREIWGKCSVFNYRVTHLLMDLSFAEFYLSIKL